MTNALKFIPAVLSGVLLGVVAFFLVATAVVIEPDIVQGFSWIRTIALSVVLGIVLTVLIKIVADAVIEHPAWPPGDARVFQTPVGVPIAEWRKEVIDAWKHIVGVQMHFNQMLMQVRNFGITLVVATIAAAGFAIKENVTASIQGHQVSISSLLILGGLIGWLSFYVLDRWYYHMLLVGSVAKAQEIERAMLNSMPYIDLGDAITRYSRVRFKGSSDAEIRGRDKLDLFYFVVAGLLAAMIYMTATLKTNPEAPVPQAIHVNRQATS